MTPIGLILSLGIGFAIKFAKRDSTDTKAPTFAIVWGWVCTVLTGVVVAYIVVTQIEKSDFNSNELYLSNYYDEIVSSLSLLASELLILVFYFFNFRKSDSSGGAKALKTVGYIYLLLILVPAIYATFQSFDSNTSAEQIVTSIIVLLIIAIPAYFLCRLYKPKVSEQDVLEQTEIPSSKDSTSDNPITIHWDNTKTGQNQ